MTENAATESPDSATIEIPDSTETANSAEATNETGVAVALPPAKKTKTSVDELLDGSSAPSDKHASILASDALLVFYEAGKLEELRQKAEKNKLKKVPLSCLFDTSSLYSLPVHPNFRMSSEVSKYQDGMKIVAMSIDVEQWKKIVKGKMTNKEHHNMFARIDEAARLMTRELEIKCGKRDVTWIQL